MRFALDKIREAYRSRELYQDLLESALATAVITGGQAALTDMTPQELTMSAGLTFTGGMGGRWLMGETGKHLGKAIDKRYPNLGRRVDEEVNEAVEDMLEMGGPRAVKGIEKAKAVLEHKFAPYAHLGGTAKYLDPIGRLYGDEVAQTAIAFAAPAVFDNIRDDPSGI